MSASRRLAAVLAIAAIPFAVACTPPPAPAPAPAAAPAPAPTACELGRDGALVNFWASANECIGAFALGTRRLRCEDGDRTAWFDASNRHTQTYVRPVPDEDLTNLFLVLRVAHADIAARDAWLESFCDPAV